jgi:hypothetical protein
VGGLARFALQTVTRRFRERVARRRASWEPTYFQGDATFSALFDAPDREALSGVFAVPDEVIECWRRHEFDILGSGWKASVAPETAITGPNAAISRSITAMLPDGHRPIDWHADLKSGYRWDAGLWWSSVRIPMGEGADIKLPWELARCHHLPVMALVAWLRNDPTLAGEVRAQITDFIAANPPMFGVNWRCAMDVAIRGANMAAAISILTLLETQPAGFSELFARSLVDHGRYLAGHLEWYPDRTGNHYLADICGLAMIAAALDPDRNDEASGWLKLAAREIEREVRVQFLTDGGHFEGSVAYHRLCLEMAAWGMAACRRHDLDFSEESWARIACAGAFMEASTKPDSRFVQIGDNDSGRFMNLAPRFGEGLEEEQLDPRATLDALRGLTGQGGEPGTDGLLIRAMATPRPVETPVPPVATAAGLPDPVGGKTLDLEFGPGLADGIECLSCPDFGLYVIRGRRLWLSVRCGGEGDPIGAHRHNDQLAVELQVDGRDIVRDPGTFCYTPDPDVRNRWRSVAAHFAPQAADWREPADLDRGLFFLDPPMRGECLHIGPDGFLGRHEGFGKTVWREVRVLHDRIVIRDRAEEGLEIAAPRIPADPPFSPGYGRVER